MMLTPNPSRVSTFERLHALRLLRPVKEPLPFGLTARELEVIRLLAHCATHAEISVEIKGTGRAVKNLLGRIFRKTGTTNMRSLTIFAVRKGLITVEIEERPSWMEQGQRLPW